jgi:prenyltransferase beta subunit
LNNLSDISYYIDPIINDILKFVEDARNPDGGYANWNNGRSSMESTYQAIDLLYTINQPLNEQKVNTTLNFIQSLKTAENGYFPLPDWDVPDISSTYRALWIKSVFREWIPSIQSEDENQTLNYIQGNFVQPLTINGPSGYSEITNSSPELLASFYALSAFELFNLSNPNYISVAWFLDELTQFTTGGVSGREGTLPKTGFTSIGIQLYLILNKSKYDQSLYPISLSNKLPFKAIDYLKVTKISGDGYSASERDKTAELSSTYFVLNVFHLLANAGILNQSQIHLTGVYDFLTVGKQPTFGLGNYPGDVPNIQYVTEGILTGLLFDNGREFIENLTGLKNFITKSYDKSGGFGFRPDASPFVKYTYYSILALRGLSDPLTKLSDIKNFIFSAQSFLGGFGSGINSQLSSLTHTFWATSAIFFLGEFYNPENINFDKHLLLQFINSLQKEDGTFSNYPGLNPTLASTYRALYVLNLLNDSRVFDTDYKTLMNKTLRKYMTSSGGFLSNLNKTIPNIVDTYYGLMIADLLDINLNLTKIKEFTLSLRNNDGGFGLRPQFSSRITSTYNALLILKYFENKELNKTISFRTPFLEDKFSPIIIPGFIPLIDTNKTISGIYRTSAKITDPEGSLRKVWMAVTWYTANNTVEYFNISGTTGPINPSIYEFLLDQNKFNKD